MVESKKALKTVFSFWRIAIWTVIYFTKKCPSNQLLQKAVVPLGNVNYFYEE